MWSKYSRRSDAIKRSPNFILPPTDRNRSMVLGKYRLPWGSFMKSSAVTTSVDVIWRGREALLLQHRRGHQTSRINKNHYSISLKNVEQCLEPETRNVGILDWRILWVRKRLEKKRMGVETYPLMAYNNPEKHSFLWWHLSWHLSTSIS